jgi:ABC-type oligopeptide transport system ATPase subunit
MMHIFKTPHAFVDSPSAKNYTVKQGAIVFDHVNFAYTPSGNNVLNDFSLDIQAGEKVALIGSSGAGKSTYTKLLLRLYDPQSGSIIIDGITIQDMTLDSLHTAIAVVSQEPILFHRTLMENIRYGRRDATDEEVYEEEEEAPLVKPAGKQPHKPLTEQEQNQLKTNLVFYSTNAHFKPKIESLVRDLSPHCIDDDDDSVEFESLNIPCMRALQKLFEDERTRRTKMLKDYHRRAKAKRDSKAEAEPMQVQPTVEAKSVEPVIAPAAEPVVESKSVESKTETVVEESKAPEPMETDEKSDDEDDSLDNVPDRTLPMRPLTPETVTCEWSTDYYSPFEGGMSDEEIKTRYGVTMPPSSPTFSAMSTTSSSTPMDAMSSSSLMNSRT